MRIKSFIKKIAVSAVTGSMLCTSVFAGENLECYNEMYRLRNEGCYLECITFADNMLAENPNFMGAYTNKALAAYSYGDFKTAYETVEKQLELNPYNKIALYNKACLASVMTDYQTVEDSVKILLDMDVRVKQLLMLDSDFVNCHENEYIVKLLFHPTIRVCGTVLDTNIPPIEQDERLLVPIRPVIEAMGATLEWNAEDYSFEITMDDKKLAMQIGNNKATLDGEEIAAEVAPILYEERSYVPVRFVAEALDFDVKWSEELGLVDIYTKVPSNDGDLGNLLNAIKGNLYITAVYGTHLEPYTLGRDESRVMFIADDESFMKAFDELSVSDKIQFLKDRTKSKCKKNPECKKAEIRVIFKNMTYYKMNYDLETDECGELLYFKNGLLTNVVEQLRDEDNYVDYYLQ